MDAEKDKLLSDEYIKIPQILTRRTSNNPNPIISPLASCTTWCEKYCESTCQLDCQSTCEKSSQGCSSSCEKGCESTCQKSCQGACQISSCQSGCQTVCEWSTMGCSSTCESGCQTSCEKGCEACEYVCQSGCQDFCQRNTQGSGCDICQVGCQISCQQYFESCSQGCSQSCNQGCTICEYCELECQVDCQGACLSAICMSGCQNVCEWVGEIECQNSCQDNCQSGGCLTYAENPLVSDPTIGGVQPTGTGSLTVIAIGTDYIQVSLASIPNATSYQIAYRLATTSAAKIIKSTELIVIITGLTPNTEYVVNYRGENQKGAGPFMSQGVTVKTRPIGLWEWYSDIAKGLPMGCLVCEIAAEHTNGIKVIPAYEWRDFCNAINDVRRSKKLSSYYFTNPVDGAQFTAAVFNEAVSAIQDMNSAVSVYRVTSGSTIKAESFLGVRDELNAISLT